jgi:prepilin signal peptidase PulO-like enzyme (type II secretory pathway)
MVYEDVCKQTIPLLGLALFIMATLLNFFLEGSLEEVESASIIALVLISSQGLFYLFKREPAMGWGDLLLSPFCGLWLYFPELPSFFLGTGLIALLMGILWHYRWGMRTFPMAPAILFGLGIVFLIRLSQTTLTSK